MQSFNDFNQENFEVRSESKQAYRESEKRRKESATEVKLTEGATAKNSNFLNKDAIISGE